MSRKRRTTRGAAAAMIVLFPLAATACGGQNTFRVCTSLPSEPFVYKNHWQDNKIVGFDVDIMELVAKQLDLELEIVDTDFKSLTDGSAFDDENCQTVAGALSITPEREEVMTFSDPYYESNLALAALPETKADSVKELEGKSLGAQRDTTGAAYAEETEDRFDFRTKFYADLGTLREAVEYGEVEAALNDESLWTSKVNGSSNDLEILQRFETGEEYGYGVQPDDTETLDAVNQALSKARDGEDFAKIYEKWIGDEYPG